MSFNVCITGSHDHRYLPFVAEKLNHLLQNKTEVTLYVRDNDSLCQSVVEYGKSKGYPVEIVETGSTYYANTFLNNWIVKTCHALVRFGHSENFSTNHLITSFATHKSDFIRHIEKQS